MSDFHAVFQKYHVWEHATTGQTAIRTTAYSLPGYLHDHVELVHPTIVFPSTKPMVTTSRFIADTDTIPLSKSFLASSGRPGSGVDPDCTNNITVSCLQQIYKIGSYKPSSTSGSRIGLTGYLEQFANKQDLRSFFAEQRPEAIDSSFKFVSVKGNVHNFGVYICPYCDKPCFRRAEQPEP